MRPCLKRGNINQLKRLLEILVKALEIFSDGNKWVKGLIFSSPSSELRATFECLISRMRENSGGCWGNTRSPVSRLPKGSHVTFIWVTSATLNDLKSNLLEGMFLIKCETVPVIWWSLGAGRCVSHCVISLEPSTVWTSSLSLFLSYAFAFWLIKASFFLATPRPHVTSQKRCELVPDGHREVKSPLKHPSPENPSGCIEELIPQHISCPQHIPDTATSDLKEGSAWLTGNDAQFRTDICMTLRTLILGAWLSHQLWIWIIRLRVDRVFK